MRLAHPGASSSSWRQMQCLLLVLLVAALRRAAARSMTNTAGLVFGRRLLSSPAPTCPNSDWQNRRWSCPNNVKNSDCASDGCVTDTDCCEWADGAGHAWGTGGGVGWGGAGGLQSVSQRITPWAQGVTPGSPPPGGRSRRARGGKGRGGGSATCCSHAAHCPVPGDQPAWEAGWAGCFMPARVLLTNCPAKLPACDEWAPH